MAIYKSLKRRNVFRIRATAVFFLLGKIRGWRKSHSTLPATVAQLPYKGRLLVYARVNGLLTRPAARTKFRRFFGVRRLQRNFALQVDTTGTSSTCNFHRLRAIEIRNGWRNLVTFSVEKQFEISPEWVWRTSEYPVYETGSKLNVFVLRGREKERNTSCS